MPFYVRKSVSAGPFRFNFSKGGVGVSVGIKGLRIGTGPRGHYVHAGRGGLYYRATLGNAGRSRPASLDRELVPTDLSFHDGDVTMIEIESGDVMHMRDETFADLLNEINSKASQTKLSTAFACLGVCVGVLAAMLFGVVALILCALAIPAWLVGNWFDSYRRTSVLYYDLEGDAEAAYRRLIEGFDGFVGCDAKWHIEAGGAVQSLAAWKRNAGASHLVSRKATAVTFCLPAVIKSNITPPALHVGKQIMFFLPDIVLVQDGARIGAVNYADLNIRWQESRFIETERVPRDAKVVDYTWKHPNKSGGPDRRFKDNRELPICLYEDVHFTSGNGVNELVEFSRTGVTRLFADGCRLLAALPREQLGASTSTAYISPSATFNSSGNIETTDRSRKVNLAVGAIVLGIICAFVFTFASTPGNDTSAVASLSDVEPVLSLSESQSQQVATDNIDAPLSAPNAEISSTTPQPMEGSTAEPEALPKSSTQVTRTTQTAANLRSGPATTFPVISVIKKGVTVVILENNGKWSRVQVDKTQVGWMANSIF